MKSSIKHYFFLALANVLICLTTYTVNSACTIILGQDLEPETLRRFKKYK